jgi:hypothetical protein
MTSACCDQLVELVAEPFDIHRAIVESGRAM